MAWCLVCGFSSHTFVRFVVLTVPQFLMAQPDMSHVRTCPPVSNDLELILQGLVELPWCPIRS